MITTPEWEEIISEVVSAPGVAMVIGGVDTGKTSFCSQLCSAGFRAGTATAVVDADIGQSEIGAPGTIGMAMVDREIEALANLKPKRIYFVGATTPAGHTLECAVGVRRMVDAAREMGARMVVLDTTGLVEGPLGRKLKTYKADLVRPDYLIAIERRREVDHLLAPFARVADVKTRRVASPELARRKLPELRASRRRLNFYNHFNDAPGHIIRLDDVSLWNTWLCTGRLMKWQYVKFMEDTLKCRVLHAEITGKGIFAVTERQCRKSDLGPIEEQFKTRTVNLVQGELFKDLLVGLGDEHGNTLNVGLIQAIDFRQRFMFVLSPMKTISPVRVVQFGAMRVTKEGRELGAIRPGEV